MVELYGLRDPRVLFFVVEIFPTVPPTEFSGFVDVVFQLLGSSTEAQMLLERAMDALLIKDHPWLQLLAAHLSPQDLYGMESSTAMVLLAPRLYSKETRIYDLLLSGSRGEFGGTDEQRFRSFTGCLGIHARDRDPEGAIGLVNMILESPAAAPSPLLASGISAYITGSEFWPNGDPSHCIEILKRLLAMSEVRDTVAMTLYSGFGLRPPPGISDTDWKPIASEVRLILGKG